MEREDVILLAQLLYAIKEIINLIERYEKNGEYEKLNSAKKELLELQKRAGQLL